MTMGSFILSTASRTALRCFLFCSETIERKRSGGTNWSASLSSALSVSVLSLREEMVGISELVESHAVVHVRYLRVYR